jgi:hypothetical protein
MRRRGAVWEPMPNAGRKDESMKSDTEIRDDVIDELRWDPQISEALSAVRGDPGGRQPGR